MDYKGKVYMCISMVVLITWLSFRGPEVYIPQWAATLIYYLMIACMVFIVASIKKEQNTLRIKKIKTDDEEKVMYEVSGEILTEQETILWIVQKMDVDEKEAERFLKRISKKVENE